MKRKISQVVMVALGLCYSLSSFAADYSFPTIMTTGRAELAVQPDLATLSVQVEEKAKTTQAVKESVDKAVTNFMTRLTKQGTKKTEIESTNLFISPQYQYEKSGKKTLVGYQGRREVTVTVNKIGQLNPILDTALQSGMNQVNRIQLGVHNREQYVQQARMAAIKDAQKKAQALADGFNSQLGKVWEIQYNNSSVAPMRQQSLLLREAKVSANDSYADQTITIRDSVDVTYRINP
ncbi:MAG: oxidative stress defense protein [Vibrio sp.]